MSKHDFDVIVVGSGFGGSVMAARLAERFGERVCVLERGKAYAPGDFPRSPRAVSQAFWNPSEELHGMFNVWSFDKFGALVSSGLGGGSLIYANVMLRKPPQTFDGWPVTRKDLDPHYARVEQVLGVTAFPYAATPKAKALRFAAEKIGLEAKSAPLAVSFGQAEGQPLPIDEHNIHGRTRVSCRMCGECNVGCNYGSKNTLDHNYLSIAKKRGAVIRTRSEVKAFRLQPDGGYEVDVVEYAGERPATRTDKKLTCKRLVLAAGALGTPYLLLKNRATIGTPSARLGQRFSTNGDLLTLVVNAKENGESWRPLDPSRGPVITTYAESAKPNGRLHYVEDAGIPHIVAWIVHTLDTMTAVERVLRFGKRWLRGVLGANPDRDLSDELAAFFGDCELSMSSLPLLGMGLDEPNGRMSLVDKFLQVDWSAKSSNGFFDELRATMQAMAVALEGRLVDSPIWSLGRVITVHPLGGAPMGKDANEGFVDAFGRAFGCGNLWVADGSVMPGPVGPNPALTIAALADRFAEKMIEEGRAHG